tara:strand:- start:1450 stop:1698 length:249 start_codon:yes stop_codon:yes gene_type:complete
MIKLSNLELRSLEEISDSLSNIAQSYSEHQDSVQDFIRNQITVTTDEPETLKQAKSHFEVMLSNLEDASREFNLLKSHLTQE